MKLVATADPSVLRCIEVLQIMLSPGGWIPKKKVHENKALLDKVVQLIKDNPVDDYENLQGALKYSFSIFDDPEAKAKQILQLSTGAESVLHLMDLFRIWDEVSHFAQKVSKRYGHEETKIVLATSPSASPNARTFVPMNTEVHVVMFYDKLLDMIYEMACLLPALVNKKELKFDHTGKFCQQLINEKFESIQENEIFETHVERFYHRYFRKDLTKNQVKWTENLSDEARLVAMDIEDSMRYFVIGHELAHILENHESDLKAFPASDHEGAVKVAELTRNHDQEYEADYVGFNLGFGAAIGNGIPPQLYSWSVGLFFMLNHLLEQFDQGRQQVSEVPIDEDSVQRYQSHPLMTDRYNFMKLLIERQDKEYNDGEPFDIMLMGEIEEIVKKVIDQFENKN